MTKIFGIGLNKTGTSTLGVCFEQLGYRHMSSRRDIMSKYLYGEKEALFELCDAHDAFEDWPYPLAYKDLFERYGRDAKFILTLRKSPEVWLRSLKKHCLRAHPRKNGQMLAYGHSYPHGFEKQFIEHYRRHHDEVVAFFKANDASDQLLTLNWEDGDGWSELCAFLDVPVPDCDFPHVYRTKSDDLCGKRNYRANVRRVKEQLDLLGRPYDAHLSPPYSTASLLLPRKLRKLFWRQGWI